MMIATRGERRARTERVIERRMRAWRAVMGSSGRAPGMARKKSPFDCGRARCGVCSPRHRAKGVAAVSLAERRAAALEDFGEPWDEDAWDVLWVYHYRPAASWRYDESEHWPRHVSSLTTVTLVIPWRAARNF